MKYVENPPKEAWKELFARPELQSSADEVTVAGILEQVKLHGDAALAEYAMRFDGHAQPDFRVGAETIAQAAALVSDDLKRAIRIASENIRRFHKSCVPVEGAIETMPGVRCWRKSVAIECVGLYIPGGTAPLFSTVLMLAIPAVIAGCKRIVLCTPPGKDSEVNPAILYAARECGVTEIYRVGGAQAIAAMRYGTETIPAVSKIFGPGNSWVTMAKQLIAKDGFPIDIPAGPSELAIFADETVRASFVAADLLSQAEHGNDSQVVLVSTKKDVIDAVQEQIVLQLETLPRAEIARTALRNSFAVLVPTPERAIELIDSYAPEHLILACDRAEQLSVRVTNAGSVFIGEWSPESAGDYASGTNHTLPTSGNAKGWGGVSVDSFVRKITFQKLTREGLAAIAPTVKTMAQAEGLEAHARAILVRGIMN